MMRIITMGDKIKRFKCMDTMGNYAHLKNLNVLPKRVKINKNEEIKEK